MKQRAPDLPRTVPLWSFLYSHSKETDLILGADLLCATVVYSNPNVSTQTLSMGSLSYLYDSEAIRPKPVGNLGHQSHEEQLRNLVLFSLKKRLKGDLIAVYSYLKGCRWRENLLSHLTSDRMRRHGLKLHRRGLACILGKISSLKGQ